MKIYLVIFTLLIFTLKSYSQNLENDIRVSSIVEDTIIEVWAYHHCLLVDNSWVLATGIPYTFHFGSIGFNTRLYYNIGEHICFGPELSIFQKEKESIYDFNFVGHYIFETPWVGVYPLAGINYTVESSERDVESDLGIVLGLGLHRKFDMLIIFAEYAHVQSFLKDDFATIGVMLLIK